MSDPDATPAWRNPRLTLRRFSGLDRSGPPPPATLAGAPLNPWTIPNAIGFVRACGIPLFLVLAFSSDNGTDLTPAIIFALVAWGDQLDGMAARVTGQYSRLGAMLDPILDRVLVVSGVVVCFHFDLVWRWALGVLVARELFMLAVGPFAVRRGVDLKINWPGRWSVWPLMMGLGFGLIDLRTLASISVSIGVALSLWATVLYAVDARRQLAGEQAEPASGPAPSSSA
ncbi:MAG: CDP-alcohol phosphatidyltransferase family protein [Solirubrobacterales bacterium]|nr:CDP-alcohol phosphatidyltransferase family protein [Solirubrobacterales bacterium]